MAIYEKKGSLLDANVEYYCHQVNCQGRMRSGIAKAIREKWPVVYDSYIQVASPVWLGCVQKVVVDVSQKTVINMFAQEYYVYDGKRYTSYDAFWSCLGAIRDSVPKGSKIGFPAKIGCGLGGANWKIIREMIIEVLGEDYEVYIYELEV